ncbi:MAG: threonine/serine dehydratase [Aestuariivirga sp.]|uniref:threonine ammonia-lyase n=1 Tax=Aestuariivirga sp. TaxID=2650926 RepID=UPI0025BE284E|nr:threonine/serine dehydratase [Aestuariivirga sp.]MCA3561990.1 threonine/serine dehydratase [Aestuariivirga sp.]
MLPEFRDIEKAARRIEGFAVRTPVLESPKLNALTGGRILIKAECLQRTGSFKFRGAWNMISRLDASKAKGGVVAYSSGNHAQGVAAAAKIKGLPALIVMPADTPAIKQENTRSYGAEVVTYDRATQSREAIAERYRTERHAVMVPPFEHADIIAGQGTAGLELAREANDRGIRLDGVLVCCSGGGLTAGVALAMEQLQPGARVHSVEPAGFDDYARSLASGRIETNPKPSGSICDALLSPAPGEMTFAINRRLLGEGLAVTDAEAAEAVRFAFGVLKIVLEPGGAVALAAVLSGKIAARGKAIGVIASGGNCDPGLYARILNREI